MTNLHDYVDNKNNWEQLWADNKIALWFEATDSKRYPYEVFKATNNVLFDDGVMITSVAFCDSLSQAFDVWNSNINKHVKELNVRTFNC